MIILKNKKAVVLRLRDPKKVTEVIPTAKLARMKGVQVVAVPHRPDEVRVLQNLGFTDIPDPFKTYYSFPGRFTPFGAQIESAAFLTRNPRAFLLNSMGLGKTITTLWAYDYLRSVKLAKRMLVICPLSVMERAWADEVFRSFPHLDYAVLYGSADRRRKLLKAKADVYIINVDGLRTITPDLTQRPDIDVICVDEAALFRNAGTNRWKTLNEVVNRQEIVRRCWGLTGAPTPNLPTDAWAQGRVINPTNPDCPKYFNRFRDQVMRQVSTFKWLPRDNATEVVSRCLQPAIRYALDDVVDLPEQLFAERDVELTPEQRHAYTDMMRRLATEYEGGQILAVNEAVKLNKILQIAVGVAYGKDNDDVVFPAKPRIEVVKEIIEESEGKSIVFVPFTGALTNLAKELSADYSVAVVHGATKKQERDQIFHAFQHDDEPRVLLANPGTLSHGLTLTAATTLIWFCPINSNEMYQQANARVRRPGQKRTTIIVHIAACDVERKMYERLAKKEGVQGVLLDLIKQSSKEVVH